MSLFAIPATPTFPLPASLMSVSTWEDTGRRHAGIFSGGTFVKNRAGELAFRKPDRERIGGSCEAAREAICSLIAGWLGAAVPRVELVTHPTLRCCALSYVAAPGTLYERPSLEMAPAETQEDADLALRAYAGRILVLDVLVGAEDRNGAYNHVYASSRKKWFSLDYALSMNCGTALHGCGDAKKAFGYDYWPQFLTALAFTREDLLATLTVAESISEEDIDRLLALLPEPFLNDTGRREIAAFLKNRRALVAELVLGWLRSRGLGTLI